MNIEQEAFSPGEAMRLALRRAEEASASGDKVLARAMMACAVMNEHRMAEEERGQEARRAASARLRAPLERTATAVILTPYGWAGAYPPL